MMTNRDNLALLLSMLLIVIFFTCGVEGSVGKAVTSYCGELWEDCPGYANDEMVHASAKSLKLFGQRQYSYVDCGTGLRYEGSYGAGCSVSIR